MEDSKEYGNKSINADLLSNAEYSSNMEPKELEKLTPEDQEAYQKAMKRLFWLNVLKIVVISLCKLSYGYFLVIFNPLSSIIFPNVYHFTKEEIKIEVGDVNMFFYMGSAAFGLIGGWLAEKVGRKRLIIIFDIVSIGIFIGYWFQNIYVLKVIRFLNGGVSSCQYMVSSVLISELFPKSISGVANVSMFSLSTAMIFMALVVPTKVFSEAYVLEHWRYFLCWPAPFFLVKAILMIILFKTDSPRWLVRKLKVPEHIESDSDESQDYLKEQLKDIYKITYRHSQVNAVVDSTVKMHHQSKEELSKKGDLKLLFSKTYKRQMLVVFILAMAAQFNGVSYLSLYSKEVFNRVSNNGNDVTFCLGLSKLFGGVIAIIFAKSFGRKFNLLFGTLLQALSLSSILLAIVTASPVFSYIGMMGFGFGFAIGLGGALVSYTPEIVPSLGVSLSLFFTNSVSIANSKLLPIVAPAVGDKNVVIFFICCCIIMAFLIDATAVETKGKQEAQIVAEFQEGKCMTLKY